MKLFVDDSREFPKWGYQCCRDADTAILMLSIMEFEYISLDYNLGRDCKSGLDILEWMYEHHVTVPKINIHSNHVIGREKMAAYCEEHFPNSEITTRMLPK